MDISVALTLLQTLVQLLDSSSSFRRDIESVWGYKSQLKKLQNTMIIIQSVLLEAEQHQRQQLELTFPLLATLERLNEALYDAEDLFDEVLTLVQHKNLMSSNNFSKEITLFFSQYNQIKFAFTKSREIKKIRGVLDDIAQDHSQFGSMMGQGGVRVRASYDSRGNTRETSSLMWEEDVIIGRDDDKRVLIDRLVHTSVKESVCCVSIVGIGGLGKTTLAQLVYNDDTIESEFELKMWVCVSNDFDVKTVLAEILAVATKQSKQHGLNLDQVQTKVQKELDGKKFLLVLDDVWEDVATKWHELRKALMGGKGSRILVTTRSRNVADIVGGQRHELKGLSEAESWNLFERLTLKSRHEIETLNGERILRKCAAVPLAIRVIGNSLRGQSKNKWIYMGNINLANDPSNEGIVSVLKISFYDLPFHLKRCFSYCAVFPKDYTIIKEDLISLWIAQGFVKTNGESLEDAGEEYFMNLLQRCFFQEAKRGNDGKIVSCKMHDLIHDVATYMAGKDTILVNFNTSGSSLDAQVCHVFIDNEGSVCFSTQMERMRTLMKNRYTTSIDRTIEISKMRKLRVLSWPGDHMKMVPNKIGKLIHLRYLDLSYNDFSFVSPSITKLFNLQILKFRFCRNLSKLPKDLANLVNLRCLDLHGCVSLKYMPLGIRSMVCLYKLPWFVLGNGERKKDHSFQGLEDLKCLKSLKGTLQIRILGDWMDNATRLSERGYLFEMEQLNRIVIHFVDAKGKNNGEALLEVLQPNHNLRMLKLIDYPNVRLPSWGMNINSCLPDLVEIYLSECCLLDHLPLSLSQLPNLRVLRLEDLVNLEYIESKTDIELRGSRQREADESTFFPSLQVLELVILPKFTGWGMHSNSYVFPQLNKLTVYDCHKLATFPLCPKGTSFNISFGRDSSNLSFYKSYSDSVHMYPKFKVQINSVNVGYILNSVPTHFFRHLTHLVIQKWNDIKTLTSLTKEVFQACGDSSLLSLEISELEWEEDAGDSSIISKLGEEDDNTTAFDVPWRFLAPTLRSLLLSKIPRLVKLPREMMCLTSLHTLKIWHCFFLEELPDWIHLLTSLQHIYVLYCERIKSLPQQMHQLASLEELILDGVSKELEERCQKLSGVDWTKIQHIPKIQIQGIRLQWKIINK